MLIQKEVAIINGSRTQVSIKQESDIPEWAKNMERISIEDNVTDGIITGKVELFGWSDRGAAIAIVSVGNCKHRVSLINLKKV